MEDVSENGDRIALNMNFNCSNFTDCITNMVSGIIEMQIFGLSCFRIFLTMITLLILCFLIRICARVLDYEITPPSSPRVVPTLHFVSPRDVTSKENEEMASKKRRYYLSPKKGCTCKLNFSSPVHN